jgi:cyclopropane-fatty-acyl-phospholipid synthase
MIDRTLAWRRAAHWLMAHMTGGAVAIADELGSAVLGDIAGDVYEVRIDRLETYEALLRRGSAGFGEAWADAWWSTDDLVGLLRLGQRNTSRWHPLTNRLHNVATPLLDPIARHRRRPDPARDRDNIRAHYDLGNAFFAQVLDETMMYSAAVFEPASITLAQASREKVRRITELAGITAADDILEIGTGWGGLAEHVGAQVGARVTTTTISDEQYQFARRRIDEAGLADRVTVLDKDYRDMTGAFDKIVSIEMIEAVDWREYGTFFSAAHRLLRPGGTLAMQAIVVSDDDFHRAKRTSDFIKKQIFPGGCLPSVAVLDAAAADAGFTRTGFADIGLHYARTLREWRANLNAADITDARFKRLWDFYFAYCEAGFLQRYVSDVQLAYHRNGA